MNKNTPNQTLDIHGKANNSEGVRARLIGAVACVGLGIFLCLQVTTWGAETSYFYPIAAFSSFAIAAAFPYNRHTYLDFTDRQIVTLSQYCGFETSKRCRPLTDFSTIVFRHESHHHRGAEEGGDTDSYSGSVGLKPVDGGSVLWVKSFSHPTRDEVPRETYVFATKLKIMTGLPAAPGGEYWTEEKE